MNYQTKEKPAAQEFVCPLRAELLFCYINRTAEKNCQNTISYEGETANELIEDFHSAIDDYLKLCEKNNIEPEKAYKGSFNVQISPELHRELAFKSLSKKS